MRLKWKIPRVVLWVKNPSRAYSAPRIAPPEQSPSQGVRPIHDSACIHAFSSPRQFSISAEQQSLFRHVSLCVFLLGFSLCMAFYFLPQPLQISFPLLRHPQPPPFAPKGTDCQTFALSTSQYSGFLVFSGSTKSPKRPWL